MDVLEHPWEVSKMFMEYLTQNRDIIQRRRFSHNKFGTSHIHPEKFSIEKKVVIKFDT